ncbi:MAG: tRNA pseudouridine(38-40) synthase TruA [Clostridioides sp.]|jgi:tRNA pseudouridine38-40 synthase|nr:tRNA pseudouridine(38-40) synthase TruA [Clostridioides sp.]
MRNIKILVQYNGKNYCGWQSQPEKLGISGEIERAFFVIANEKIKLIGSGRTDAGVHATGQVANFKCESNIEVRKIPDALNAMLPKDISIIKAEEVNENFHSRYSAKKKKYKYIINNSRYRNPIISDYSYQVKYDLDVEKMKEEAKNLLGSHDFCSFMSSGSSVKDTVRTIESVNLNMKENIIEFEIVGNGFLYNMVRIIVGTLVDIGRGKIEISMKEIIENKSRGTAGHTAPPQGLFLEEVLYE